MFLKWLKIGVIPIPAAKATMVLNSLGLETNVNLPAGSLTSNSSPTL
jgi:hypothetical protein